MGLSTDRFVRVECAVCGEPLGDYQVRLLGGSGPELFLYDVVPRVSGLKYGPMYEWDARIRGARSGRRRYRIVDGRDGEIAARFECRCTHVRVIGPTEIRRALKHASDGVLRI